MFAIFVHLNIVPIPIGHRAQTQALGAKPFSKIKPTTYKQIVLVYPFRFVNFQNYLFNHAAFDAARPAIS